VGRGGVCEGVYESGGDFCLEWVGVFVSGVRVETEKGLDDSTPVVAIDDRVFIQFPVWLLAAGFWVICLSGMRGAVRDLKRRRRAGQGRCVNCDYDLRATKGRCPNVGRRIWK